MKRTTTIFRLLIVLGFGIAILAACVDEFVPGIMPAALLDAYDAAIADEEEEVAMPRILAAGVLVLALFVGVVAATTGLLLFKRWSRQLALWISLVSVLSYPLLGPMLYSGWAYMLTETSMMMWGAALAMAYFSELKVRFEPDEVR